jgi:hypothetical protein
VVVENTDSYQELKRLEEQIESATELAALKPIYFRLNEIIQAFPGDFDVQFTGNEIKQRLMARGTLLKQQGNAVAAPPAPPTAEPAMELTEPSPPPGPSPDMVPAEPVAPPSAPVQAEASASPAPPVQVEPAVEPVPAPPEAPAPAEAAAPPEPAAPPPPPPRESPDQFIAAPSPSFPLFPLFAGTPQPEPPAPPAYFADTVGPAPVSPYERTMMGSATPLPVEYQPHGTASPEPPALPLSVAPEEAPLPPPPPAIPAPPLSSLPGAFSEAGPPAYPSPSPLFDFAAPEQHTAPFGVTPEQPPQPPAPPLAAPFLDSIPPAPMSAMLPTAPPPTLSSPLFDTVAPPEPPAPAALTPEKKPAPPAPRAPFKWKRLALILPIVGLLVAAVVVGLVMYQTRVRNAAIAARNKAAVQVDIATTPPGAAVKVVADHPAPGAGPVTCTSNCKLDLTPGSYQISASLDGFDPAAGPVTVKALKPVSVSLTLQPQAQSVRLLTDLPQGKVVVDDHPAVDLQEGQLVLDRVAPGKHTMKITGPNGDASFSFEVADARQPVVTGPVTARNMIAVLVASFGKQARIVTNAGPWKLAVNGQPQSDATPAGTDLTAFQPGVNEIVLGEGKDQRNMSETFGAAPALTAFLKTDVNAGTLIVSTGQDGVHVFVNGKEDHHLTQHGQLRIPVLGKVSVRVTKPGFQEEPVQTAEVKKGAEVRLQFNLRPAPQFGSLQVRGAIAGTEILLDQKVVGTVGPDGLFSVAEIPPGEHNIELRHDQRLPKRVQRAFQAGQAVVLTGADVVLAVSYGTVRFTRNPASAVLTYHRADETETREIRGNQIELPPGTYVFLANAPGFSELTRRIQLSAGESQDLDFTLAHEKAAAPAPVVTPVSLFENADSWTKDGDSWVHKGGGFLLIKPTPKGVLTFTVELVKGGGVFRSGQIRWCVQYVDPKNYLLSEIDRKNFWTGVVQNGKRYERVKAPHGLGSQKTFTVQLEVASDRLVQKVRAGNDWKTLDTFAEPGRDYTQGKFGFLVQGNDEIAITDFKFQPR